MNWNTLYPKHIVPTLLDMNTYVQNPLWESCNAYLQETYSTTPTFFYSGCVPTGGNVKYKKGGKALTTLYLQEGFFIALVVISANEKHTAELLLPTLTPYTQNLYATTKEGIGQRWLMLHVTSEAILQDVKDLIALRKAP